MTKKEPADSLAAALERARELAPRLAKAADKLNELITEAERAIASLNLGVRGSVDLWTDPETGAYDNLTFGKYDKGWRLLLESGHVAGDETTLSPLVSANRETRLFAIRKLPQLVESLIKVAQFELERVEEATAEAEQLIATIAGAKKLKVIPEKRLTETAAVTWDLPPMNDKDGSR